MRVDEFDFELPDELIALEPAQPRDAARMLVVDGGTGQLRDRGVRDLVGILRPGDAMVFNDTKVIPAQFEAKRVRVEAGSGEEHVSRVAFNLHLRTGPDRWVAFCRPAKRVKEGDRLELADGLSAQVIWRRGAEAELAFNLSGDALDARLDAVGVMPLPPYIASKRAVEERDASDYQTIYARERGAVAAPTAGLHFTPKLFDALEAAGVSRHFVTLHVGAGTFLPVTADTVDAHKMHFETGTLSDETAAALNEVRETGGRVVCVGTTSMRILETAADASGRLQAWSGDTDIFITPGYTFKAVDCLMTNFHLPKSTLFMLVSAFAGLDTMRTAYAHAIAEGYRFYSYGDASLLFPQPGATLRGRAGQAGM